MNDFFTLPKALCSQEIRVRCISKDNDIYHDCFEVGKEYDAYYRAPSILHVYSEFEVFCTHGCCHYLYDEFFKHFQVLTVGFEPINKIELTFANE